MQFILIFIENLLPIKRLGDGMQFVYFTKIDINILWKLKLILLLFILQEAGYVFLFSKYSNNIKLMALDHNFIAIVIYHS